MLPSSSSSKMAFVPSCAPCLSVRRSGHIARAGSFNPNTTALSPRVNFSSSFTLTSKPGVGCSRLLPSPLLSTTPRTVAAPCMRIATDGDSVLVHYSGYLDDGTMFDSSLQSGEPLNFVVGGGDVIRGFDDAVRGLTPGESRRTRIDVERAYGKRTEDLVFSVAKHAFPSGVELEVGRRIPLTNGMSAAVVEISEEKVTLDANHHLAGKALTFDMELVSFAEKILPPPKEGLERAVFGLGCFWGAELAFQRMLGVSSTKVGYSHGEKVNPTYKEVCSGSTGHTEAVAVDYDPQLTSYQQLLALFWERLGDSALTPNQVGNDVGTQYRSGIYYQNEAQAKLAEQSKRDADVRFGRDTVVEVVSGEDVPFYLAENYHQQYLEKGGQSADKGATEIIRCYG